MEQLKKIQNITERRDSIVETMLKKYLSLHQYVKPSEVEIHHSDRSGKGFTVIKRNDAKVSQTVVTNWKTGEIKITW
jgi:hypothetical protein